MDNNPLTTTDDRDIQLDDHPLPYWWKLIFATTLLFGLFYMAYYHIGAPGRSTWDRYDYALAANTRLQFAEIGDLQPTPETIMRYANKSNWVQVGKGVFKANCVSCHGRDGEGKVGPNLTDEYYKNVRKVEDIARVVLNGAGNGAMPAWASRLHPNEVVLVSAYVANLRGTDVDGKGPEGNEIPAWPAPPPEPEAPPPTETTES